MGLSHILLPVQFFMHPVVYWIFSAHFTCFVCSAQNDIHPSIHLLTQFLLLWHWRFQHTSTTFFTSKMLVSCWLWFSNVYWVYGAVDVEDKKLYWISLGTPQWCQDIKTYHSHFESEDFQLGKLLNRSVMEEYTIKFGMSIKKKNKIAHQFDRGPKKKKKSTPKVGHILWPVHSSVIAQVL